MPKPIEYKKPLLPWLAALNIGDKLAVVTSGRWGVDRVTTVTLAKLTAQDIVVTATRANGEPCELRFRHVNQSRDWHSDPDDAAFYTARRDGTWGYTEYLYPIDSPKVAVARAAQRRVTAARAVTSAAVDLSRTVTLDRVREMFTAADNWLRVVDPSRSLEATITDHVIVSHGMTVTSPDECSCGERLNPVPPAVDDEEISMRRRRAYAAHLADRLRTGV